MSLNLLQPSTFNQCGPENTYDVHSNQYEILKNIIGGKSSKELTHKAEVCEYFKEFHYATSKKKKVGWRCRQLQSFAVVCSCLQSQLGKGMGVKVSDIFKLKLTASAYVYFFG